MPDDFLIKHYLSAQKKYLPPVGVKTFFFSHSSLSESTLCFLRRRTMGFTTRSLCMMPTMWSKVSFIVPSSEPFFLILYLTFAQNWRRLLWKRICLILEVIDSFTERPWDVFLWCPVKVNDTERLKSDHRSLVRRRVLCVAMLLPLHCLRNSIWLLNVLVFASRFLTWRYTVCHKNKKRKMCGSNAVWITTSF